MKRKVATVLVVDDDPLNLKMVKAHLKPLGYCVLEARDGSEGLKVAQEKPDLILLDIMMPGISGFETCRSLKANENTKDIPVIFLSLLQDSEAKASGFQAGGVDYVTKPFDPQELLARVKTHLTIRKQELQLKNYTNKLQHMVQARTQQLVQAERMVQQEMQRSMEKQAIGRLAFGCVGSRPIKSAAWSLLAGCRQKCQLLPRSAPLVGLSLGQPIRRWMYSWREPNWTACDHMHIHELGTLRARTC